MNRFRFGGLNNPKFYLDETVSRMCYTHRRMFAQLGTELMKEGKKDKARKLVERAEQVMPPTTMPHSFAGGSLDLARIWLQLGDKKHAESIALPVAKNACEYMEWYLSMPDNILMRDEQDCMYYLYQLHRATEVLQDASGSKAAKMMSKLDSYNRMLQTRLYGAAGMSSQIENNQANMPVTMPQATEPSEE